MRRAMEQDMVVTRLDIADDSFIFHVEGVSGDYMIEIYEDVGVWPPTCDCPDYFGEAISYVNTLLCLALMGVGARLLEDCDWEPEQEELYELLGNAPSCVGCSISQNHITNKGTSCN